MKRVVVFDIDGVWTNGKLTIDASGKESKQIDFHDIDAFFLLKRQGHKTAFITGEGTPIAQWFQGRFEPDYFFSGEKNKLAALHKIQKDLDRPLEDFVYIGDSRSDMEAMQAAGYSYCPNNALDDVKQVASKVLQSSGGDGAIAEMTQQLLAES